MVGVDGQVILQCVRFERRAEEIDGFFELSRVDVSLGRGEEFLDLFVIQRLTAPHLAEIDRVELHMVAFRVVFSDSAISLHEDTIWE